jgi:hypothetical protein
MCKSGFVDSALDKGNIKVNPIDEQEIPTMGSLQHKAAVFGLDLTDLVLVHLI